MTQNLQIKLDYSSILNIPLNSYCKDFTFIVNNKEFKTSRLISEILSPRIVKMHLNDPTFNTFIINTHERGDFSKILDLVNFKQKEIPSSEIDFTTEVLEILNNEYIQISFPENKKLTNENVFKNLQKHPKYSIFYKKLYEEEIGFIASHFYELITNHEEEFFKIELDTLQKVIKHDDFQIEDEDQLLTFVNKLFKMDDKYSILYENVYFANASSNVIKEFIEIYEVQYINQQIWQRICDRLEKESNQHTTIQNRYIKPVEKGEKFLLNSPFDGIINHLRIKSNDKIENLIEITASSCGGTDPNHQPKTILLKENQNGYFYTSNVSNSWLKLDFKNHRVIPKAYTIRSKNYNENDSHLKNWVFEVSKDDKYWEIVDEQKNCSYLNGKRKVHTFNIQKQMNDEYQFIRIRQTDKNWYNSNNLTLETLEIFGTLI